MVTAGYSRRPTRPGLYPGPGGRFGRAGLPLAAHLWSAALLLVRVVDDVGPGDRQPALEVHADRLAGGRVVDEGRAIGGVVERWKCGAPRPWNSFFHGPRSGSPQVRA